MPNRKHLIFLKDNEVANKIKNAIVNFDHEAEVEITEYFEPFYKKIENDDVDCLFLAENCSEIPALKLVEKLRKTKKFHRTIIGIVTDSNTNITPDVMTNLEINFSVHQEVNLPLFEKSYKSAMQNYTSKLIPANYKVLVIDDDKNITEIISEYLIEADHKRNTICHSFAEAKSLINDEDFDLILTDWNLPDGSCIDVFNSIKDSHSIRTQNATIVVITGRSEIDDVMTLLKYKVEDFIIKPFDNDEFEEKIEYALKKRAKRGVLTQNKR